MNQPDAPATHRNREPLLRQLTRLWRSPASVLEIGSGTGQHAIFFAHELPHLQWITSDRLENHAGIRDWLTQASLSNVQGPLELDVLQDPWPETRAQHVFSANTCHIMPWDAVEAMIAGAGALLPEAGQLVLYGPFKYGGEHTSESNVDFDAWLHSEGRGMGVRDYEAMVQLADTAGLDVMEDNEMPANNRLLVFAKS